MDLPYGEEMNEKDFHLNLQILQSKACGETNESLQKIFDLRAKAIGRRIAAMCEKFSKRTEAGALRYAILEGLIAGPEPSPMPSSPIVLSEREKRLLGFLLSDYNTNEIATLLNTRPHNVNAAIHHLNRKFAVHSREHLVALVTRVELDKKKQK